MVPVLIHRENVKDAACGSALLGNLMVVQHMDKGGSDIALN